APNRHPRLMLDHIAVVGLRDLDGPNKAMLQPPPSRLGDHAEPIHIILRLLVLAHIGSPVLFPLELGVGGLYGRYPAGWYTAYQPPGGHPLSVTSRFVRRWLEIPPEPLKQLSLSLLSDGRQC